MATVLTLSILGASTLITSFISGILGMAGGMILMGVLLALVSLPAAMMLHGISQLASNGWRAFGLRHEIDWRVIGGYCAGASIALAVFLMLRIVVQKPVALLIMGLSPFLVLALPEKLHLNVERPWHSFLCGLVSLSFNLTAGIAGPILDLFFVRSKMSRHRVVANKAMTQSLSHVVKITYFGAVLSMGSDEVTPLLIAVMISLSFIGTSLSRSVLERMTDTAFRKWTRWTVMSLGAMYLASGVKLLVL